MADKLGLDFALIHRKHVEKVNPNPDESESEDRMELLVGNVKGKTVILIDDMIDTGRTITLATKVLKDAGADKIYVIASHGLFRALIVARHADNDTSRRDIR